MRIFPKPKIALAEFAVAELVLWSSAYANYSAFAIL